MRPPLSALSHPVGKSAGKMNRRSTDSSLFDHNNNNDCFLHKLIIHPKHTRNLNFGTWEPPQKLPRQISCSKQPKKNRRDFAWSNRSTKEISWRKLQADVQSREYGTTYKYRKNFCTMGANRHKKRPAIILWLQYYRVAHYAPVFGDHKLYGSLYCIILCGTKCFTNMLKFL